MEEYGQSERQASKLLEMDRSSYRYQRRPDRNTSLRADLIELARQKPRFGYRRLHVLLKWRGHEVNVKRVHRLYREEHLAVRRLRRKRVTRPAAPMAMFTSANQEWSMDFVMDGLATGRAVRALTLVDSFSRECLAIEVDGCLSSRRVTRVLEWVIAPHSSLGYRTPEQFAALSRAAGQWSAGVRKGTSNAGPFPHTPIPAQAGVSG